MILRISDDFEPDRIAESGQCFRWTKTDDSTYRIIAGKSCLYITASGNGCYDLDCSEEEYNSFWSDYFDFQEDFEGIWFFDPIRYNATALGTMAELAEDKSSLLRAVAGSREAQQEEGRWEIPDFLSVSFQDGLYFH